jgi:hypothetical protein
MIFERYYSYIKNYQSEDGQKFMDTVYNPKRKEGEKVTPFLPHQKKAGAYFFANTPELLKEMDR